MAKQFQFDVITPTETVFTGDVIHVRAPGVLGDFGILADHAPMVAAIRPGKLQVDIHDKSVDYYATSHGYLEVHGNRAVMLVEMCLPKQQIDVERALKARERALQELAEAQTPEQEKQARVSLDIALAQIKVAEE